MARFGAYLKLRSMSEVVNAIREGQVERFPHLGRVTDSKPARGAGYKSMAAWNISGGREEVWCAVRGACDG